MSEIAENTLGLVRAFMRRQFPGFDYDREYKMLKPKVLFHTWVAIYGSGIFDGTFALPKTGRKLDYVSKIKSNARFLEKQRIPLMIVYSSLNLPLEEERRMLSQFEREPNIVVLNLERDLKDALPEVMYQENYSADLNLMDYLRLGVIKQAYNVLAVLRDAALARDDAPRLSDRVLAKAKEHSAMFSSNSRESRMRLFEYVRSGGSRYGQRAVRKEPPPRMHLTAKVKSVLREQGVEEDVLHKCILNPENHGRIASSSIMSALDVLIRHDLILPEETYEVTLPMGKGNPDEACRFLRSLCESPASGAKPGAEAWSLPHNMHASLGPRFDAVDPGQVLARFDAL
ncbi:hypothetical protein Q5P01_000873 [Channa striata]|uniref:Uncharacterized protein n=1 Tax=Channa striata TaxID=64152 RepID=A0AA88LIQ3_CHASR|nr:hypothetical protein Q5P01_000873 [Channa striata]